MKELSIEDRIRAHYGQLTEIERSLADTMLNFPGELASYTATELATLASVSKSTATRFFKRLGYASFEDARRAARASQRWGSPLYLNSRAFEALPLAEAAKEHLACELENLRATFAALGPELDAIVTAVSNAHRVACIGFRRGRFLADYLRWQLVQIRTDVHLIPPPGETVGEYLVDLGPEDLVVAIGVRRRMPILGDALRVARERGVPTLLIADPTGQELVERATWFVSCEARSASLIDSDSAVISLSHFLASAVAARLGPRARKRMQAVEASHAAVGELSVRKPSPN
jgi:DNA-binding MurR/RpiR family transcriptional regulator